MWPINNDSSQNLQLLAIVAVTSLTLKLRDNDIYLFCDFNTTWGTYIIYFLANVVYIHTGQKIVKEF